MSEVNTFQRWVDDLVALHGDTRAAEFGHTTLRTTDSRDKAQMVGAMNTVEPIPGGTVHSAKKRVRPERAAVDLVTPDRPLQLGESRRHVHGGRRGQVGIDGDAGRDAVLQCPGKHTLGKEPSLEAVPAQIKSVDRTIDAVGEMLADLCERPMTQRVMLAQAHPAGVVEHLREVVEVERPAT